MDSVTITTARNELPAILRRLSAEPEATIGITVNGRLEAVLTGPQKSPSMPTGWIHTVAVTRQQLPEEVADLLGEDNRGSADVWIHLATSAFVVLVPKSNWDQPGKPAAFYVPPDRRNRIELIWPLGSWTGHDARQHGDVMDDARRYVGRTLASVAS